MFSWLVNKFLNRGKKPGDGEPCQTWLESGETKEPFGRSRRRGRLRRRPSATDAGAVGVTGAFLSGPLAGHDHNYGHGGFDGGFDGGGDAGGGF